MRCRLDLGWNFGFHKMRRISWLAQEVIVKASQEEFWFIVLVCGFTLSNKIQPKRSCATNATYFIPLFTSNWRTRSTVFVSLALAYQSLLCPFTTQVNGSYHFAPNYTRLGASFFNARNFAWRRGPRHER
jgi:Predicted iron-dependent peroxidase